MWRSAVLARKVSLFNYTGASKSVLNPLQVQQFQNLASIEFSFPSHFSSLLNTQIYKATRFFSSVSSDENQDTKSPVNADNWLDEFQDTKSPASTDNFFDEFQDSVSPVSADNVFDESPRRISSALEEHNASNDTLKLDEFASGEDESSVVEEGTVTETQEVDLEELEGVLSLLQSSDNADVSIGSSLETMKLTPNEEFVVRVVGTPCVPGENLIGFFKWVLKRPEFSVTTRSLYALVQAICIEPKMKIAYELWDLVKDIAEKEIGVVSTEILNELLSVFSRLGEGKTVYQVLNKFEEFDCFSNSDTYYYSIEGLCRRKNFDLAVSVSEKMLTEEKLPEEEKTGRIISLLCKGNKAKDAHSVYTSMKANDKTPPQSIFNYLISTLCRDDKTIRLALEMLEDISDKDRKYAIMPFSYVLKGLCRKNDVEGAKSLLYKMIDAGPPPGNAVFNSIINRLSKNGDMEDAMKMVKVIESRGLKPDVYTYTVIMSGYVKGGDMEKACEVLAEAKKKHKILSPVTYHTLIRGYCKLEEFDKAVELLGEMKEFGVQPNADEYHKLIQSICLKNLDYETARKLHEEMKENGLHLNGVTKGLLEAVKELVEDGVKSEEVVGQLAVEP